MKRHRVDATCQQCDRKRCDCGIPKARHRRQLLDSVPELAREAAADLEASQWTEECGCGSPTCPWDAAGKGVDLG